MNLSETRVDRPSDNMQMEKDLSLDEILQLMRRTVQYLLSHWKIIILLALAGCVVGMVASILRKKRYVAELSFVLEDAKTSPLGAYAGLASQFGFDLGGSGSSGIFSGDNILEFLKSRLIVERSLLSPINVNGKQISLADHFISFTDLKEKMESEPALGSLRFPVGENRKSFSRQQDSILHLIYRDITSNSLTVGKPDKKLSFIEVSCTSLNEAFSKQFTETLVKEATDFYVKTRTQRSLANIQKLQEKADSLEALLNQKTYSAAASQDLNQNPARRVSLVSSELIMRDKTVLFTMYGEVIKNLEISRTVLSQESPILQIVDTPILPLKVERWGKAKSIVLGGIIAGLLACIWLVLRKIFGLIPSN